jgi:hypothetical protein
MNREILILRQTVVKLTQLLTGMGLLVTQQGSSAFVEVDPKTTKPKRINIPHIPDNASRELMLAIQGFIDHEVAHVLFTDWAVQKKSVLRGEKFNNLRNLLEDTYIERKMGERFPGSVFNVKQLHQYFISEITEPALRECGGDPMKTFAVLLVPLVRALAGQEIFKMFMKRHMSHPLVAELVKALPKSALDKIPKIQSTQDSYDLAQVFFDIIYPSRPSGSGDGDDGECTDDGSGGDGKPTKSKREPSPKDSKKPQPAKEPESEEDEKDDLTPGDPKEDEADGEDENTRPKPKPKKKAEDADDEDADEGPSKDGDDDGGEDDDAGQDDDGDDPGEDDDGDGDGSSSAGDGDEEDGEDGAGSGDEDGEEDESGGVGHGDDDEGGSSSSAEEDDSDETPDRVEMREGEDDDEGGEGNPKPSSFATSDVPAAPDFETSLSDKIADDTSRAARAAEYRIFTRDFDVIERFEPRSDYQNDWLVNLEDQTRAMVGLMQKEIERMMAARSQVVKVPGYRSGRLNSAGLHRLVVGDDRVFRRKHEAKSKETAVGLLIDNSGSMHGAGKIKIAMTAGYALSQTLERVGLKHEVLGFTTGDISSRGSSYKLIEAEAKRIGRGFSRYEPLYMPIYKDFDERLTPEVKRRFASVAAYADFMRNNLDGECVEIAVQRLAKRPEKRKVLLVLSDGQPYAAGSVVEQTAKLRSVIADAKKYGVDLVGIGILDRSVSGYYDRHIVLGNLTDLPKAVMGELKQILLAA